MLRLSAAKPVMFTLCLLPFAWLVYAAFNDQFGANPAEALIRSSGDWTLRMLCVVLAVTPSRQWFNAPSLARFRRMLGLFVFFYAALHLLCYAWLDMGFELDELLRDIAKRPFILVGFLAFLLLAALAVTSPKRILKAMGARRWQLLHRAIYLSAGLALLHFFWMRAGKNNFNEVMVYVAIIAVLLLARIWKKLEARRRKKAA
ncbi:sulfoxide reductase heme-binding subunit YedZ [Diaphorobacter sp. HDW4A]|uniref:sulfite oxidase heme-binding subunit YedZ n=1 Tax=Diaphorobacter sp. HDW4A TaxID=2714924 RepID=UPI00140C71DF|nr:protein-methionine-sulfoxide reductase heme-binding subunit MsrQ [Diaphorobacter sp. HDW4A]QIL83965.1 sulfoxide reductase heme-binding subunit YedZ [Diaphorobacter sp. HDW4A]